MVDQVGNSRSEIEERLLGKKFGKWYNWEAPKIVQTTGPFDPKAFDSFSEYLGTLLEKAKVKLTELSQEDLISADEENVTATTLAKEWAVYLNKELNTLRRRCPGWFAGGFGNPKYAANFKYWAQMETLSLHEALLVSVGVEPKHIDKTSLADMKKEMEKDQVYAALEFLVRRRIQFQRKFQFGYDDYFPMGLRSLKTWFEQVDLEIHPEFKRELEKRFPTKPDKSSPRGVESLSVQERKSLLKLVAGMACEQYSFKPSEQRSSAISSIRDDLEAVGLEMDSKTIRKWLLEATKLVPDVYWE